ncbi:MAG: D-alanyl-D-alanine carboxypeptidase [Clostridia bacterium]|nr:D-alanyl-D-alanine carboxypeptidase [Clostridia bacterium]
MKRLTRVIAVLMIIVLLAGVLIMPAQASSLPAVEHAQGVYLYNLEHDMTIFSHRAEEKIYPASTVKIMTGLVAVEALAGRMEEKVTVTAEMLKGVTGNNIALKAGEIVTIGDMLYAGLCGSANDACAVLAHVTAGSLAGFVTMMNEKAAALGAASTHYTNASGMHNKEMVTTTADTARIALAAAELPLYMEITSAAKYVMPATNISAERNIHNRNYLIARNKEVAYYYAAARGMNAGSTNEGGYCVVTTAERNGLTYLCVVMGAEEVDGKLMSYTLARELLNWVFDAYGYVEVLDTDRMVCEVPVTLSDKVDYVTLMPEAGITRYLPTDLNFETDLTYSYKVTSASLAAPVEEGQVAGFITVSRGEELLGTVNLVTKNAVERSEFLYVMEQIKSFTRSRFFIATLIAAVVLTVLYVLLNAVRRYRRQQRQMRFK